MEAVRISCCWPLVQTSDRWRAKVWTARRRSLSLSLPLLDFIQWQINGRLARGRAKSSRINWPTKVYDLMMYRDAALIAIKIAPMDADYWRFRVHWCLYPPVCAQQQQPRNYRAGRFKMFFIYFETGVKYSWLISRNGRLSLPRLCYSNWRPGVWPRLCTLPNLDSAIGQRWYYVVGWRSFAYVRSTSRVGFNLPSCGVELFSIILRILFYGV